MMKAAAKCYKHCELHDSVNHLKVERIFLFRVVLEIMFSECHCLCVWAWVCGCECVCVLMASKRMSWFVFMVVCLIIFLHFNFRVFFFSRFVLDHFSSIFS